MLIAIISEIFMSTLVKSQDFDRDAKTKICIPLIPASVNAPYVKQVWGCNLSRKYEI